MSAKQIIADRYEIVGTIGQGGMGDVYRGHDLQTGDTIAIKLLKPDIVEAVPNLLERFEREGQILRQLDHPNIVKMLATVEEDGLHYIVMEYVSGGSLRDLLDEQPQLPIDRVMEIALDLADALTRAHRLKVIHRDIKPANVLLAEDSTPRLTDFGVAHIGTRTRVTETGSLIGTYAYLSPEACMSEDLDARTDIWAFGVMLYEMLAGRRPFESDRPAAVLVAIMQQPHPPLTDFRPDTPPPLVNLINRMLEKKRDERIPSVRQVGAELEAMLYGLDTPVLGSGVLAERLADPDKSRFATPTPFASDDPLTEPDTVRLSTPGQQEPIVSFAPSHSATPTPTVTVSPRTIWWGALGGGIAAALVVVVILALVLGLFSGDDKADEGTDQAVLVEPVEAGEYMVLVAQLEPLDGVETRDVTRFVVEDLAETLEENVPYSDIRIRAYPAIIASDEEALAAAEANSATVVIWGNYTPDFVELRVQVGVLTAFKYIQIDHDILERTANTRVRLTDERAETVALSVMDILIVLFTADGDGFEMSSHATIYGESGIIENVQPAEVVGGGVPAHVHQGNQAFLIDPARAVEAYDAAIDIDAGNPLLYIHRAVAHMRLGHYDETITDLRAAKRLGPPGWTGPLYVEGTLYMYRTSEMEQSAATFEEIARARPDDWFAFNMLGASYYLSGDYATAQPHIARAIELQPTASFPYMFAIMFALREGRLVDMQQYMQTILTQFPDPTFSERMLQALFGSEFPNVVSPMFAASGNLILGRYAEVLDNVETALAVDEGLSDLYYLQGLAYCNLGQYAEAEAAYTRGIELDPDLIALYALRSEVRYRQDNLPGALEDSQIVEQSDQAAVFVPLAEATLAGKWSCENFFDYDYAQPDAAATAESVLSIKPVAPVAPGEYMVLVAALEPLGDVKERDVARFIVDDLVQRLELEVPFSKMRVRAYPDVITTDDHARLIARANEATVIVWGNYTPDQIELNVQVGATTAFKYIEFERDMLERTGNVRVHLVDERRESIAVPVMSVINVLAMADGDDFEMINTLAVIDAVEENVTTAEIVGSSPAAHIHRAIVDYVERTDDAIDHLDAAIALDGGNALAYVYRSLARMRLGEWDETDFETARKLGPDNWGKALTIYVLEASEETSLEELFPVYDEVISLRPDDWYIVYARGANYYLAGEYDLARRDLEAAIALDPAASLPYFTAMSLALREGRIAEVQTYTQTVLREFPDPAQITRTLKALFGEQVDTAMGQTFSAMTYLVLGQIEQAAGEFAALTGSLADLPDAMWEQIPVEDQIFLADVLLWQGIAECMLADHAAAEATFSLALERNPDLTLAYLLRGRSREQQGDSGGAQTDFAAAQAHTFGPAFDPWVEAALAGEWTCTNFFDYQPEDTTADE